MVPPPPETPPSPPVKPKYSSVMQPSFPRQRGQRRNFHAGQGEHSHLFPVGTVVMVLTPSMPVPSGPYKVKEFNGPLFHGGPPQYIVVPVELPPGVELTPNMWLQISERYMYLPHDPALHRVEQEQTDMELEEESSEEEEDDEEEKEDDDAEQQGASSQEAPGQNHQGGDGQQGPNNSEGWNGQMASGQDEVEQRDGINGRLRRLRLE